MLLIYSIIIFLTFTTFSLVILDNYKTKRIKNEEIRLFQTANVVADTYGQNQNDIILTKTMVNNFGKQANARILITDVFRKVLVDNYNTYTGTTINNAEIRSSLLRTPKAGIYNLNGENVLQLSVPITLSEQSQKDLIGTVLLSASLETVVQDTEALQFSIIRFAILALFIALFLTILATNNLTKPLRDLTYGVEKISSGHLGYKVKGKGSAEIIKLINTFNEMSTKLSKIEKNRKGFINSISHELRTPLTSIKSLLEALLLSRSSPETVKEYLLDIDGEIDRMNELVNYLTGSLKLEDLTLDLKKENIGEILEETTKLLRPYAEKKGVAVRFDNLKNENIIIRCDKHKLKEALLNLLENAVKYRDSSKEHSYVTVGLQKNKNKALITIEDNGVGIAQGDLKHIFQRGFRILDERIIHDAQIEGYGIGLAIAKNIIDKHNWQIGVQSSPEVGSIFTISIPLKEHIINDPRT
jgi:signal transduction histidine kinase